MGIGACVRAGLAPIDTQHYGIIRVCVLGSHLVPGEMVACIIRTVTALPDLYQT